MDRELVFTEAPFASCHASTIAALPDGTLLCAWFAGAREGANDVAIWGARRTDGGWEEPRVLADAPSEVPCWNPVLHAFADREVLLFFKAGTSPQTWSGLVARSTDAGATFEPPDVLPAGILGPVKNKPLELPDGTLVCGSSVESYRAWGAWVERTRDRGLTWTKHGPIDMPGLIQPAIFGTPPRLAMLCRSRGAGRIVHAESTDAGLTWSTPTHTELPHNNSGIDAVQTRDGRVVLVYNHTTSGRTPLNVATSTDFGLTWQEGPILEDEPGEYSYPAVIQSADGAVHITYTWRRTRIAHVRLDVNRPEPTLRSAPRRSSTSSPAVSIFKAPQPGRGQTSSSTDTIRRASRVLRTVTDSRTSRAIERSPRTRQRRMVRA